VNTVKLHGVLHKNDDVSTCQISKKNAALCNLLLG
jgi:hypothetical protein